MNEIGVISIEDFLINLLAGKKIIKGLYDAVNKSIEHRNNAKEYYYYFPYPMYESKQFSAKELIELNMDYGTFSDNYLVMNLSIENIIRLLLKRMTQINKLYEMEEKIIDLNNNGRRFFYTFNNPFSNIIKLDKQSLYLTGEKIKEYSLVAERIRFQNIF